MVTVFSTPACFPCKFTKQRMDDLGIDFVDRDVSTDQEAAEIVRELGYKGVPVVLLDSGEHWQGLNPDRIDALVA